ncbi:MAG: heme-binding protein [Pseudomonadota bacterium]
MKRLLLLLFTALSLPAMATETPDYEVVKTTDDYELRRYSPYLVAEVDVNGSMARAGNSGFRILANYIFGDNRSQTRMNMTAPVESIDVGEKMAMTAPVESVSGDDGYTYAFVMERRYSRDTLPMPNDSRIRIVERPARLVAASRFSGRMNDGLYERKLAELEAALERDGVKVMSAPMLARYDAPMVPGFLRRNEIMMEIAE